MDLYNYVMNVIIFNKLQYNSNFPDILELDHIRIAQ